jgi:acetyl esterase/lipase
MGLATQGRDGVERAVPELRRALSDASPSVRVTAAEALALHGVETDATRAKHVLLAAADLKTNDVLVAVLALNALDALDGGARDVEQEIRDLPRQAEGVPKRMRSYVPRLIEKTLADIEAERPPVGPQEIVYKTVGETALSLFVHRPVVAPPSAGYPAVVFFFGGGWNSGTPAQFDDQCELLARRGMVAITADYRVRDRNSTTPFACVADGKSALRFVRANARRLGIDPTRIAAGGGSAGGHIAAAIATVPGHDEDGDQSVSCRPDALILFNPVFDNGPGGYGHARLGDRWRELSPAHNIAAGFPPAIVFLGTKDKLIPVETAQSFAAKVRAVGGRCDLKLYEGSGHGFFNRGRKGSRYDETVADMTAFLVDIGWIAAD